MLISKIVNLTQLEKEMKAAGIAVNGLGTYDNDDSTIVHTYDAEGTIIDLPEAASAIIDAHMPGPQQPTAEERLAALEAAMLEVVLGG